MDVPFMRKVAWLWEFNLWPVKLTKYYGVEKEMTTREYLEDEDAEEPDDFVISLTSQASNMIIYALQKTIFQEYTLISLV